MFINKTKNGVTTPINELFDEEFSQTYPKSNNKYYKQSLVASYSDYIKSSSEDSICIPLGISTLDAILNGGLRPGLYIFGSNPGVGKTTLILDMMRHLAEGNYHSVLFNLEMSEQQIASRLFSNISYSLSSKEERNIKAIPITDFLSKPKIYSRAGFNEEIRLLLDEYSNKYDRYINIFTKRPDNRISYVETIETTIKNYKEILKVTPVIFVDFLQLLSSEPKVKDELDSTVNLYDKRLEVNEILENLKVYSNIYQVPIILITSISRSSYTKDKENVKSDDTDYNIAFAKESGNIEYLADLLVLLTREGMERKLGGPQHQILALNILKSRFGPSNEKIKLEFIPEHAYFREMDN